MHEIVPIVIMTITFLIPIARWSRHVFYFLNGEATIAVISSKEKSRFYLNGNTNNMNRYYKINYTYSDRRNQQYHGSLSKLYRESKFKNGSSVKIRYLNSNPSKSKCFTISEYLTYEPICLLAALLLFVSIFYV